MELTLQDTISSKKKLIGMYLPIQIAVYVPSTKDANVPISQDELNKRVDSVRKYLADMFGGFSSDEITGGYISTFKELIKEDIVKVIAFSTKEAYEENKQKLITQISKWAKEWSQEAIGLEFENDLYYINQSETFKSGGKVEVKETSFLNGYEFSDYEDMISTLKRAKKEKYDLGDSTDVPNDFHKEILKAIKLSEDIKDEYKYNRRGDSALVVKVKLYPDYDLDKAIESASSPKKLTDKQVDEIKEYYNDEFIYEEITQFIDMNRQDSEETLRDFIELNICKDEILFEGRSGGYLIFHESDFFDEIVSDLEDNYAYKNFDNEGNFDSTEYDSYDEFLQKCGVDIRDYIGIIHYYNFAFGVFEAYVKKLISEMEKTGFQDYLIGNIEMYIDDNFNIKAKKAKKTKVKKEEMVDEYALGGKVTESSVESFLTNKVNFSKGNIAVNYSGDNGFLFHYGTLIAKIKGKSLTINEKYFSKTTSSLSNLIERLAKDKGMVVSKAVFFDNGGNIANWDEFKGGSDMVVNDSCVKLSVWLIKDIYPIEDWFILKSDNKLVIVFIKSLTDEEIENVREILSQFAECHYLLSFENLEKKDNGRSISIDLKYDNVSVGEFSDGGEVQFIEYNGNEIMFEPHDKEYFVNDEQFSSLEDAKKYIDDGSKLSQKTIDAYRHGAMKDGGGVGEEFEFGTHPYKIKYKRNDLVFYNYGGRAYVEAILLDKTSSGMAKIKVLFDYIPFSHTSYDDRLKTYGGKRVGERNKVLANSIRIVKSEKIDPFLKHLSHTFDYIPKSEYVLKSNDYKQYVNNKGEEYIVNMQRINRHDILDKIKNFKDGGGVGEDKMVYISISNEVYSNNVKDSVIDYFTWKHLEKVYPDIKNIPLSSEMKKNDDWKEEDGYPYEIGLKAFEVLNNFDVTRNGIALMDLKTGEPILRQRWSEYRKSTDSFVEKPDINKYSNSGGVGKEERLEAIQDAIMMLHYLQLEKNYKQSKLDEIIGIVKKYGNDEQIKHAENIKSFAFRSNKDELATLYWSLKSLEEELEKLEEYSNGGGVESDAKDIEGIFGKPEIKEVKALNTPVADQFSKEQSISTEEVGSGKNNAMENIKLKIQEYIKDDAILTKKLNRKISDSEFSKIQNLRSDKGENIMKYFVSQFNLEKGQVYRYNDNKVSDKYEGLKYMALLAIHMNNFIEFDYFDEDLKRVKNNSYERFYSNDLMKLFDLFDENKITLLNDHNYIKTSEQSGQYQIIAPPKELTQDEKNWDSITDKFHQVYFEDSSSENNTLTSDQVKAGEYAWQFDKYSKYKSILNWDAAEKKFKDSLTKEELGSIEISYKKEKYADLEEHDTEKYHKQIFVKQKKEVSSGGSAMDLINKLKSKDRSVVQEALREIKKNNEPIQQVELKKINIPIDYKSAISDIISKISKYSNLNQEEAEYLYDVFKDYEALSKNEDGNYVSNVKFAYNGSNFKETEEQDSKLELLIEGIEKSGFIYYDSYDSIIEAYSTTIDFVNSVRGRFETRKNVSMGLDLFPETSKIQEANPKYNDILSKKIVLKTLIFQYTKQKDSSIKEKLWDKIQLIKNEIKDMENHEYKDGGDVKSKSSILKKLHALSKHKNKSEELLNKYDNMNSELKSKKGSSYEDILKGGKSDGMDEAELAKKHGVTVSQIKKQIEKGISIEKEHTDNLAIQMEIAKDHIEEFVDYYDRLEKMEKQAKIKNTIKTNKSLSNSQITSISSYLKKKGLDSSDFDVSNNGIVLIYKDLNDKVNKEISLFIKNSVI